MQKPSLLAALLIVFALSGCTQYAWVKPFGDPATYPADNYACQQDAMTNAPPVFQTFTPYPAYSHPDIVYVDCRVHHHHERCRARYVDRGFPPPSPYTVDLNDKNRGNLYSACMQAKGWVFQPVEEPR
jgi:hypothetical protein